MMWHGLELDSDEEQQVSEWGNYAGLSCKLKDLLFRSWIRRWQYKMVAVLEELRKVSRIEFCLPNGGKVYKIRWVLPGKLFKDKVVICWVMEGYDSLELKCPCFDRNFVNRWMRNLKC